MFDDTVNEFLDSAQDADGFIFGSPVHFAAAGGAITSFMDRVFYTDMQAGRQTFYLKPAAAVVSARRAGTTVTFDQLNKYFTISEMPVISSRYWNMVHGAQPDDVKKDLEGLQTMRVLARNMAFFLKCKEAGLKVGVHSRSGKNRSSRTLSGNDCSLQKSWKIAALGEIVYGYVKRDAEQVIFPKGEKIANDHFIGTAWLRRWFPMTAHSLPGIQRNV